ncbi:hypothetical protein CW304_15030 [Bacillus sp. UFRGS-B20]|nr:hypothetical protein CW304_15030 [Bacillus sp. UFRGS-B20]
MKRGRLKRGGGKMAGFKRETGTSWPMSISKSALEIVDWSLFVCFVGEKRNGEYSLLSVKNGKLSEVLLQKLLSENRVFFFSVFPAAMR